MQTHVRNRSDVLRRPARICVGLASLADLASPVPEASRAALGGASLPFSLPGAARPAVLGSRSAGVGGLAGGGRAIGPSLSHPSRITGGEVPELGLEIRSRPSWPVPKGIRSDDTVEATYRRGDMTDRRRHLAEADGNSR